MFIYDSEEGVADVAFRALAKWGVETNDVSFPVISYLLPILSISSLYTRLSL